MDMSYNFRYANMTIIR